MHAKKLTCPDASTKKERFEEARRDIQDTMAKEGKRCTPKLPSTRFIPETNIIRQIIEVTIPVKIVDLLETLPRLQVAMTQGGSTKEEHPKEDGKEKAKVGKGTNTLFTIGMGRTPNVVEMEIMGCKLTNAILDKGLAVNVLPEETWKALGKPTLWPPTFQLVGADQHGIRHIGMLMGQKVVIDTQQFFLDFVVINLEKNEYNALLGRVVSHNKGEP